MIDKELEQNLNEAFQLAHSQDHEFVTVEHLLLSLLVNSDSLDLLQSNNINIETLKIDLEEFIGSTTPKIEEKVIAKFNQPLGFKGCFKELSFMFNLQARKK